MRGTVLATWRKELGWSQERLASELGVEPQLVEDLERSPNITPLLEGMLGLIRMTLAAMKSAQPQPARDDLVARGPIRGGVVRARRY
jgi:ribosome-binding protein aMBF1 (putative translation factor)